MLEFAVDRDSGKALYYQLYEYLKERIITGDFKPEEMLPSENEMISLYKLSRITIRRAIDELEREGYLEKTRGKGTKVLLRKPLRDNNALYSFSEMATMNGNRISYVVIFAGKCRATSEVADALGISAVAEVFRLQRLILFNERIAGLTTAIMPYKEELRQVFEEFDGTTSLYAKIEKSNVIIDWAEEVLEVVIPPNEVRKATYIKKNEPMVYSEHRSYDRNDKIVTVTYSYFIYNTFKCSFKAKRGWTR
ncbi:MAG: GntR family transcriptional regulator [Synergistaceae bacterium]|jgi:GntR family transcriptional regulator|nr:GntR family transcriptional regulator [Synergistaceae bacterium]